MRNVDFRFTPSIAAHVVTLTGELRPGPGRDAVVFDDKQSFDIAIAAGIMTMTDGQLTQLMNGYVFAGPGAALKDITVQTSPGTFRFMAKKGGLPVEIDGAVDVTPQGLLRIRTTSAKMAKVPAKKLLDVLGLKVNDFMKDTPGRGVRLDGNDVLLDVSHAMPPPVVRGRLTAASVENGALRLTFGRPAAGSAAKTSGNYMRFQGHRVRFGKLTMDATDLTLVDATPADPFDFCLDRYKEQLVAGEARVLPDFALRVVMPDFGKLPPGADQK